MKTTIEIINGYEVKFDSRTDNTNIAPYSIKYGPGPLKVYVFKTLKAAKKWAENH